MRDRLRRRAGASGSNGPPTAAVDATAEIRVHCSHTANHRISLAGDPAARGMSTASATGDCRVFSDPGRTSARGNTTDDDTVGARGRRAHGTHGRLPARPMPTPRRHRDAVTVTITH